MRVRCDYQCGFRQDGQPLLEAGETVLDEAALTHGEKEFIKAMVDSKLAEFVPEPVPVAPVSETKRISDSLDNEEAVTKQPARKRGKKASR